MIKDRLLVIGMGNTLMGDDGVGVHVINEIKGLKKFNMSGNTDVIDGGTAGIDLLDILSEYQRVVVVDAIKKDINSSNTVRLFSIDSIVFKNDEDNFSIHDLDITSTISLMKALKISIPAITIVGIPAVDISPCMGLSEECRGHIPIAIKLIVEMIRLFSLNPRMVQSVNIDSIMEDRHDCI